MKDAAAEDHSASEQSDSRRLLHRRRHQVLAGAATAILLAGGVSVAVYSKQAKFGRDPAQVAAGPDAGAVLQLPTAPEPEPVPAPIATPPSPTAPATPPTVVPRPVAATAPAVAPVAPRAKPVEVPLARLKDPSGSAITFLRGGTVRVSDVALPAELSAELYRIYVLARVPDLPPVPPGSAETVIGLTAPDPADAGLETPTPVFRWAAVPGAASYRFTLERLANAVSGEWQPVAGASGQTLTGTEWVVPGDAPLARGARYRWRVESGSEGDTLSSSTQSFRVLDENELRRLEDARRRYGNIPFLLGPHYEAFGLYAEAIWEYLKLARANPASPQAQRALENARLRAEQQKRGVGT